MKALKPLSYLLFLFCSLAYVGNAYSQYSSKGDLSGKVIASDTKEPLPSATVMIVGTHLGTTTDLNGNFFVRGIKPGVQHVSISYVGCQTRTVEVVIRSNNVTQLKDVLLNVSGIKGKPVVVTAQRTGQQGAINQQLQSNTIVNVVAADRLQENPDANVAEAIGRLPGVSLIRSGGEGVGIVIRGMSPSYSKILMDGVTLPSSASIAEISQYAVKGVEVFKSITPDMEGDATAGAVNLRLGEAPSGLRFDLIAQPGYNDLNNYWKNYRFVGGISDRFLDDKLGMMLSADVESVNRGDQALSAGYETKTVPSPGQLAPLFVDGISLNDISRINERSSASLVLDYRQSSVFQIVFDNFYAHSDQNYTDVTKSYDVGGGHVNYSINYAPDNYTELYVGSIRAEHQFQSFELDEGVSFTQSHVYTPGSRNWSFSSLYPVLDRYGDTATESLPLSQILAGATDTASSASLNDFQLDGMGRTASDLIQIHLNAYINSKLSLDLGSSFSGYVKYGLEYRESTTNSTYDSRSVSIILIPNWGDYATHYIPWAGETTTRQLSMAGLYDYTVNNFMKGQYNFGWYPNINRLNQVFNWWNSYSYHYMYVAPDSMPPAFSNGKIGFTPNWQAIMENPQKVNSFYYAAYLMSELDFGDLISFTPGVRFEKVKTNLGGWWMEALSYYNPTEPPGHSTEATHNDQYWLPMIHLKIKPANWLQGLLSFTQTLKRPADAALQPNVYLNRGQGEETYSAGNPDLKPEFWTNYDAQVAVFGGKIGLATATAFYKTVRDFIWTPSLYRVPGQPWLFGAGQYFSDNSTVLITVPQNHNFLVYLKGLEFDIQTNLWYLPQPFTNISIDANFTLINSTTKYEYSKTFMRVVGTDSKGRPITKLVSVDSVYSGPMLNQPKSIANISLGYNYKGFNLWLSYQYTGAMVTSFPNLEEFEDNVSQFVHWDLQATQRLPLKGLSVLFDYANINDPIGYQDYLADPTRPTYLESYGWTMDLGLRYSL